MSAESIPAVGIDLGTTYSAVAYLDEHGRPVTLVNAEGDLVTPSVVLFESEQVVVGKEALKAMATEAEHVAQCVKRELGDRTYHKVLQGRKFPPEAIQAFTLNKLKQDARRQIGPFNKVVITVPAYFDEVRRKATQDAGYMAGLEVLDIINEPTAAAIAYGFLKGFLDVEGSANKPRKLLVYDLGGGTFDVTVMEIKGAEFTALATDGDVQLGGQDWDQRLMDFVAEEFINRYRHGPAARPQHGRPPVARVRRRQTDPLSPSQDAHQLRLQGTGRAGRSHPREVRRNHPRLARPDAIHDPADAASLGPDLERHRQCAAGGRFDAHADGRPDAAAAVRQGAGRFGGRRRGRGPRRRAARRRAAGQRAGANRRCCGFATSTRTAWASWPPTPRPVASATRSSSPATRPCR